MLVTEEFPIFHVSSSYFICICQCGQRKEVISLEVCLKKAVPKYAVLLYFVAL